MKKVYQAPAVEIVEMEVETQMMTESNTSNLPGTGTGDPDDPPAEGQSNRFRGEWGNLWAED